MDLNMKLNLGFRVHSNLNFVDEREQRNILEEDLQKILD